MTEPAGGAMVGYLFLIILAASVAGYFWNRAAARALRASGARMHSLSSFHGGYAMALAALPPIVFLLLWLLFQGGVIEAMVRASLPADILAQDVGAVSLVMSEIRSLAGGRVFGEPPAPVVAGGQQMVGRQGYASW
ncbi:MAG: phosphate ABC transporter permease family protein, partial [Rubrimonas sp.]